MSFDVAPQQDLYTKQGVAVTVEAVAQIKVKSDRGIDPDRGRAVSDQDRSGARRPDPTGDGRPSARHHRPAHGGRDREAARDGGRPHARHLRRRHEQDGAGSNFVHHQGSARQERIHHQHGQARRRAHQARRGCSHGRSRARYGHQARLGARGNPPLPRRRPTRNACSPKRLSLAKQAEAQRDLEIKKAQYLEVTKKQQAQADKAYDIQTNIMQQQVVAEQREGAAGRERRAGKGAGSRDQSPRERTHRDGAEAGARSSVSASKPWRRPKGSG